jgi:hypothetical protein
MSAHTCETCGITSDAVASYKRVDGRYAFGCPSSDVGCFERWKRRKSSLVAAGAASERPTT